MANYVTLQEVREQAGFQFKETGESLGNGDGSTVEFTVGHKPIVDRDFDDDIDADDVVVYASGSPVTVSSVDSDDGKVTLQTAPTDGSPITIDYDWSSVKDEVVQRYLDEAHDLILSKLAEVYALPLSETPNTIKLIEKRLAAGYLLDKEFSVGGEETEDTRGRRWIKWGEQKLEDIVNGKLELLDSSGNRLSQKSSNVGMEGWPDETTEDEKEEDSGGEIQFRIMKEF